MIWNPVKRKCLCESFRGRTRMIDISSSLRDRRRRTRQSQGGGTSPPEIASGTDVTSQWPISRIVSPLMCRKWRHFLPIDFKPSQVIKSDIMTYKRNYMTSSAGVKNPRFSRLKRAIVSGGLAAVVLGSSVLGGRFLNKSFFKSFVLIELLVILKSGHLGLW